MKQYKIIEDTYVEIIENGVSIVFQKNESSRFYQKFIKDVAEQGMGIVEGPDVKSSSYAELRAADYPSREAQLDMMYWDKVNGTNTWQDTIQEIKNRHPKTITGGTTIGDIPAWVQEAVDSYNAS